MLNSLLWNLLLTAVLAIALVAMCRLPSLHRRPALRHWLWLLLLAKLVTPPLIVVPLLPASPAVVQSASASAAPAAHVESIADAKLAWEGQRAAVNDAAIVGETVAGGNTASQGSDNGMESLVFVGLIAASLFGTGVIVAVQAVHAVKLMRWLRRAGSENALLAASCEDVASSLNVSGSVRSCVVDARTTPLLWGWHRPMVVVPRQLIEELSPVQLRGIIAHELAHLVRRDHWANAFVLLVKTLLWWNPVVWWADRELRAAQELCCDAIAIDRCKTNRRGYAATLLKALDFIQTEPTAPRALAAGMGSRASILRRFEMIGETRLSYKVSRWMLLMLLALAIPLVCIPVRGQGEDPAAAGCDGCDTESPAGMVEKKESTKTEPAELPKDDELAIDPKIKELGDATRKRITTFTDFETLTLTDGQTGRMKIKKNSTPAAVLLITPHFVEKGTKFDLEALDENGKAIKGTKTKSGVVTAAKVVGMLADRTSVDDKAMMGKVMLTLTRPDAKTVAVNVKALFTPTPTADELKAMLLAQGKIGRVHLDFQTINGWIWEYRNSTGANPKTLADLKKTLPKDVYSPTGEDYHYEVQRTRYIVGSCGKDGVYGTDDDEIVITDQHEVHTGPRRSLYPLAKEKGADWATPRGRPAHRYQEVKGSNGQTEMIVGERPKGKCSISGMVVAADTGKPIKKAKLYLHYNVTHGSIFVDAGADGKFSFKDIPAGPFSLCTTHIPGYRDVAYNPDKIPTIYPPFTLKEGENRTGIVLKAESSCRISGTVRNEEGDIPEDAGSITILAWCKSDRRPMYESRQTQVNPNDGSYSIDGLANKPVYVMAINWQAARQGNACPPIYYPGTFSRNDAKLVTFDKKQSIEGVDITLKKAGGVVLEGTVRDEAGKPVSEAFVVVNRRDMLFDFVTAYTDEQGHYTIQGLGEGEFAVHVDALNRGFVRTRTPLDLDKSAKTARRDFTLARGVTISGKLVDEKGNDWAIGTSYGFANTVVADPKDPKKGGDGSSYSLTRFWNKYLPQDVAESAGGSFALGDGPYPDGHMHFPTESTFVIYGMQPGTTKLEFLPCKERQKVLKIMYDGRDVQALGIETKAGQEIKDVKIVIGADK